MTYTATYLSDFHHTLDSVSHDTLERLVAELVAVRNRGGRLFFLGVGGSAANCSHAVNDFRKIAGFEAYTPTDNVAEITARTNDDGWDTTFERWLMGSRLRASDAVFVLSVGGGTQTTSLNLVHAVRYARQVGATVLGIVGRDGGYTAKMAQACVVVKTVSSPFDMSDAITPYTESMQSVLLHLLVFHPHLRHVYDHP